MENATSPDVIARHRCMVLGQQKETGEVYLSMAAKVSVIVPNYNHAPYLEERLESIFKQDYPNYEVILLDDCSTDESKAILERYAQREQVSALVVNTHNSGNTFAQWKKGIAMAKGEYIWMAESDDVAEPQLLSTLVAAMEKDERISVSFCASRWIDNQGQTLLSRVYRKWQKGFVMDGKEFIRRYLLGYNFICNASAVVMRRSAAMEVGDQCMKYRASGDRQFWIEMALQGYVSYCPTALNGFRQHPEKVSNRANRTGANTREDLAIYAMYREQLGLNLWERMKIRLYHLRARLA